MGSEWVKRLYDPGPLLFAVEVLICAIGVPVALMSGDPTGPLACVLYTFSTYVLGIGIFYIVLGVKWIGNTGIADILDENRYVIDRAATYLDLLFSSVYAIILTVAGIDTDSPWMYSAAGFYLIVGIECFILSRGRLGGGTSIREEAKRCFIAGIVMLLLTVAIITMVIIAIVGHNDASYPGVLIYFAALFTFIFFITAIVNVIRYRGFSEPVYCTVRRYRMNKAIYSMFVLQLAMFSSFGNDKSFETAMNIAIGIPVCIAVTLITLYQLYFSYRLVKETRSDD